MTQHRVHCTLSDLLALRPQGQRLSLRFDLRTLEKAAGGHLSRLRGRGLEFCEHRVYQAGDDLRAIDWKVTARRRQPYTKVFHEEIEQPLVLIVDQRLPMFFGSRHRFKATLAAEVAALLLWAGLHQNDRVGGLILGTGSTPGFKPVRQPQRALRFLQALSACNLALRHDLDAPAEPSLVDALHEARRLIRPGGLCFVISDWSDWDTDTAAALAELNRHHQSIAIQVFDPLEKALPTGRFAISDGRQPFRLELENSATLGILNQALAAHLESLPQRLAVLGTPCIPLSTWEDPAASLGRLSAEPRRGGVHV